MDTSESIVCPTPTNRDIVFVGAAAGLTAGLSMALWATLTSVWHGVGLLSLFELIGATFAGHDAAASGFISAMYGLFVHSATAAGLGILFTALLPTNASQRYATGAGMAFGLVTLLAMTFVITPVANPVLRDAIDSIPKSWIIQHALFGLTLGVVPSYWRYYHDESVRVRGVEASRRTLLVRRPPLPAAPLANFPRITRARATLRRAELFGSVGKPVPPGSRSITP